jgi:hypothetical protein
LIEQRDAGGSGARQISRCCESEVRNLPRDSEWFQVSGAGTGRHGIGDVGKSLWRLADWGRRDHLVGERINNGDSVAVLQSDIDAATVAGRTPNGCQSPDP